MKTGTHQHDWFKTELKIRLVNDHQIPVGLKVVKAFQCVCGQVMAYDMEDSKNLVK